FHILFGSGGGVAAEGDEMKNPNKAAAPKAPAPGLPAAVLAAVNAERTKENVNRAKAGKAALPLFVTVPTLTTAAVTHNNLMIAANELSHQLKGEAGLGARLTAAGYTAKAAG